jgi:Arc/MetJ-type ribon-helix-helix transcriptional regulator
MANNKKLLWFTNEQAELLEKLKKKLGTNNSETVRKALKLLADNENITYENIDAVKQGHRRTVSPT